MEQQDVFRNYIPYKRISDLSLEEKFIKSINEEEFSKEEINGKTYYNSKYNIRIVVDKEIPLSEEIKHAYMSGYGGIEARMQENLWKKVPGCNDKDMCMGAHGRYIEKGLNLNNERGYVMINVFVDDIKIHSTKLFYVDYGRIVISYPFEYKVKINNHEDKINDKEAVINMAVDNIKESELLTLEPYYIDYNDISRMKDMFLIPVDKLEKTKNKKTKEHKFYYENPELIYYIDTDSINYKISKIFDVISTDIREVYLHPCYTFLPDNLLKEITDAKNNDKNDDTIDIILDKSLKIRYLDCNQKQNLKENSKYCKFSNFINNEALLFPTPREMQQLIVLQDFFKNKEYIKQMKKNKKFAV